MITIHPIPLRLANVYLIEDTSGFFLVDAGMPGDERHILRYMDSLGRNDLKLIFITHAHIDHYGSAAAMKRITGAPIAIHGADAQAMANGETRLGEVRGRGRLTKWFLPMIESYFRAAAVQADLLMQDRDDLNAYGMAAEIIKTPGHTPGSSSLWVENRHVFVGDLLSTKGSPHAQRYYASDWSQIPDSLRRIQALQPEKIYPGHGLQPMDSVTLKKICTGAG